MAIPPETRFLLPAYWQRRGFGDLSRPANRHRLARWIVDRRKNRFGDLGLDREQIVAEITEGPGTLGSALGTIFRGYAARFGKPRWGDKRPAYLQNLDVILRLFPDAQIINVVRYGRACVASLKEMSWNRHDIYGTLAVWSRAVADRPPRDASRRRTASQWHQPALRGPGGRPAGRAGEMCGFLGEQYDPAMADPSALARLAVRSSRNGTADPLTASPPSGCELAAAAHRGEIALCETALGRRLTAAATSFPAGPGRRPRTCAIRDTAMPHRLAPAKTQSGAGGQPDPREPAVAHRSDPP